METQDQRKMPTAKQNSRLVKIMQYQREPNQVEEYFYKQFPNGDFENPTREQAQKIITGLAYLVPIKPVYGVVGRDIF